MSAPGPPAERRPLTVVIADDDEGVRAALGDLIGDEPGLRLVGSAPDAMTVIDLAGRQCPDVAVLDVSMPGGGIQAARELRRLCPGTAVIGLSSAGDRNTATAMLEAGAVRFLVKGAPGVDVAAVIVEVGSAGRR